MEKNYIKNIKDKILEIKCKNEEEELIQKHLLSYIDDVFE